MRIGRLTAGIMATGAACAAVLGGCQGYQKDDRLLDLTQRGEFGEARAHLHRTVTDDVGDRNFMLDRMKLVLVSLADGVPEATEGNVDHVYDYLRTAGVNEDKTVPSFLFGEGGVRIWKGEPFEQAMGYHYVAVFDGMAGDWGNVRAAANNSLFLLRDFSGALREALESGADAADHDDPEARRLAEREALIRASAERAEQGDFDDEPDALAVDYTAVASDFEVGYVMRAIAARRLGLTDEVDEVAAQMRQFAPRLNGFMEEVRSGDYNTVLVADYGIGPEKYRAGPDGAVAMFRPSGRAVNDGNRPLVVSYGGVMREYGVVTDLNRLAMDLRWNNLEDMRVAKSYIGTGLVAGGAVVAMSSRDTGVQLAGLGMMAAGALMKGTAGADTRHCEVLPQRVYIALLALPREETTVEVQVQGRPESRLRLAGLRAPEEPGEVQLRYVRLPMVSSGWAVSGRVYYSNDETGETVGAQLPYILGGTCVRTPSEEVLSSYQRSGYLAGWTLNDLMDLYREEGIVISGLTMESERQLGRHILEGGNALYTPRVGTTGFARLYGQRHGPYSPRSSVVRELAASLSEPVADAGERRAGSRLGRVE